MEFWDMLLLERRQAAILRLNKEIKKMLKTRGKAERIAGGINNFG
jgi:hypothetical protein